MNYSQGFSKAVPSPPAGGRFRLFWAAILLAILAARFAACLEKFPSPFDDEIVYVEPAVNYVEFHQFSAPAIAVQSAGKGIAGLAQQSFLSPPLAAYLRIPVMEIFGAGDIGRRLSDFFFVCLAAAAFLFAAGKFAGPELALASCSVFLLNRFVGWSFGRPDVLSLALGLVAWGLVMDQKKAGRPWVAPVSGLLIGLAAAAHPFGGIFWGTITVVTYLSLSWATTDSARKLVWLVFFCLGGVLGACVWLPQILTNPQAWHQQFFYMLNLKKAFTKSFLFSARGLFVDTVVKNPVVLLTIILAIGSLGKKFIRTTPWNCMVAGLLALWCWRCHGFESYVYAYAAHFWGVFCLLFAWAAGHSLMALPRSKPYVLCFLAVLMGFLTGYSIYIEAFLISFPKQHHQQVELLQKEISPADRVLVCSGYYFNVPTRNKVLWYWGDQLNLKDFDVIVSTEEKIEVFQKNDQWPACFTPQQAGDFNKYFQLETSIPEKILDPGIHLPAFMHHPQMAGLYIWKKKAEVTSP